MHVLSPDIRTADYRRRYETAFRAYLAEQDEETLRSAYELGRDAVARGLAVLELAAVHHDVLSGTLREQAAEAAERIAAAAGDFLVESLSAFEMAQRTYRDARERALVEQQHAAMLRQLSTLLSDTSLAAATSDALSEVLQLVAEQARELTGASTCTARARVSSGRGWVEAAAHADVDTWSEAEQPGSEAATPRDRFIVPLLSLAGSEIGALEITKPGGETTDLDEAILLHIAQMTAATIERARLYRQRR
jgi:GAF domain-containing protein